MAMRREFIAIAAIISALKNLEKQLTGNDKEKVRALRREFERREGISKRKKLALLAAGLIAAVPAAYALVTYLEHQRPSIYPTQSPSASPTPYFTESPSTSPSPTKLPQPKIYSVDYPLQISTNSNLPIKISADADEVLIQLSENGVSKNITASNLDKVFYVEIPVKEGFYVIEKVYAFKDGNALVKDINTILEALDNPVIHSVQYERSLSPGKEALIKVNASDTSGIKEAIMLVNAPDKQFQIDASQENGVYVFMFPLEKEPSYSFKIVLIDPFNQSSEYEGSISSLDNPVIHSFLINKKVEEGIAQVLVNASDTSGIAKAWIEINGNNYAMEKVDGLYTYIISLGENPASFKIRVYVIDPFNQSSSVAGEIHWLLKEAFQYYSFKNGIRIFQSERFYSQYKDLVEWYYLLKKEDLLPALYVFDRNATLLAIAKGKVYNDPSIRDNSKVFLELSKALFELNVKSLTDASLNYLGNLTAYLKQNPVNHFGKEKVQNVLDITEASPIVLNGLSGKWQLNAFYTFLLTYLANNDYQKVKDYPYLLWALAYKGGYIVDLIRQGHLAVLGMCAAPPDRVKNFDIMKNYDTNNTYLELLLARENQILDSYEKGLWLIGLKPEEILPLTNNSKVTADLWMLQVTLPFSIISGDVLKGNWIDRVYPDLCRNYPEQVILLAFSHNLDAMNKLQRMYLDYLNNATFRSLMNNRIKFHIEDDGKVNAEGARDLMALFNNGSIHVRAGLFIRSSLGYQTQYGVPDVEEEEFRVDLQQVFGASIGLPIFGGLTGYTLPTGSYAYDGMMTLPLTHDDYKLLKSIDQSELIWDPATMQLYPFITRTNANYYRYLTGFVRIPGIEKWWISYPAPWSGSWFRSSDMILVYEYKNKN